MYADSIIKGKAIFDSVEEIPFEGYVAVVGNKISNVGKGEVPAGLSGPETKIYDMGDRTVMSGFHDSHVHLLMAGLFKSYVNLAEARSEEDAADLVRKAAEANPKKEGWVVGFSWYHVFWDSRELPSKKSLDKWFPDRPVCLINAEAHGAWVNSKALEIAGIHKDTPDPFGGEIARDEKGEATGFLYESASGLVTKYAFQFTPEEEREIVKAFLTGAAAYGITSANDVQPYFHGNMGNLDVYHGLDVSGELTVRVHAAPDLLGDLDQILLWKEKYGSPRLKVDMAKQFLDGVATTHTALMLDEYADAPGVHGISLTDTEAIKKAVPEAHKRGISVKLHSCGDLSARMALDYYEEAIDKYGKNSCRHAIEHIELLSSADLPRFKSLGIIPSVQPEHLALTQIFSENPYPIVLGTERAGKTWQFKSLYDTAGVLAIGSDCPVVDNNPFYEIYRAITRIHNDGEPKGGWNPAEKLSLYEILRSYTYGSAYGVRREAELGTLEPGKFADIITIDRNLFASTPEEIYNAKIYMTMMDGDIIYFPKNG